MLVRMQRHGTPCALLEGFQTSIAAVENSMAVPQKSKNSTSGTTFKGNKNTNSIFTAALLIIAKTQKLQCPLMDEQIKKL